MNKLDSKLSSNLKNHYSLTWEILSSAISKDREQGLIPFCLIATLGTTSSCAFDNILSLGPVCNEQVQMIVERFLTPKIYFL